MAEQEGDLPALDWFDRQENRQAYGWGQESPAKIRAFYEKDRLAKERKRAQERDRLILERTGLSVEGLEAALAQQRPEKTVEQPIIVDEIHFGGGL